MATKARYAEIRFNDRPIKEMRANPEALLLEPGEITADYEAKSPWRLDELYPDIARYRAVSVRPFIDADAKAREEEKMWSRVWLLAGVSSDIPDAGDWFRRRAPEAVRGTGAPWRRSGRPGPGCEP